MWRNAVAQISGCMSVDRVIPVGAENADEDAMAAGGGDVVVVNDA